MHFSFQTRSDLRNKIASLERVKMRSCLCSTFHISKKFSHLFSAGSCEQLWRGPVSTFRLLISPFCFQQSNNCNKETAGKKKKKNNPTTQRKSRKIVTGSGEVGG